MRRLKEAAIGGNGSGGGGAVGEPALKLFSSLSWLHLQDRQEVKRALEREKEREELRLLKTAGFEECAFLVSRRPKPCRVFFLRGDAQMTSWRLLSNIILSCGAFRCQTILFRYLDILGQGCFADTSLVSLYPASKLAFFQTFAIPSNISSLYPRSACVRPVPFALVFLGRFEAESMSVRIL